MTAKTEVIFESGTEIDVPLSKLPTSAPWPSRGPFPKIEIRAADGSPSGSMRAWSAVPIGPDEVWHPLDRRNNPCLCSSVYTISA